MRRLLLARCCALLRVRCGRHWTGAHFQYTCLCSEIQTLSIWLHKAVQRKVEMARKTPKSTSRSYNLGRRAEQQAETRQRIAEATLELHGTFGPAATTLSMIAERAGVQRHTLYAHFPEER